MKRDVEAFKALLWRWHEAENDKSDCCNTASVADGKAYQAALEEAEATASQARAAVLAAFQAEPDDASLKAAFRQSLETGNLHPDLDNPAGRNVVNFLRILADFPPKMQLPPPQNSRDSDFP